MRALEMKRTPDDDVFAAEFGRELKRHYDRATKKEDDSPRLTDEQFAATLDVTRPALMKYLKGGATPTLRVVVLAFLRYGVNVSYTRMPLFGKRVRKVSTNSRVAQLVLPFSVRGLNAGTIQTKVEPKGVNSFEIWVDIQKAG
jgi:transcriptional regulator with XRE-family HTH domain